MSRKPNPDLPAQSRRVPGRPDQVERSAQRAERTNADGSREEIELMSERYWSGSLPRPEDFAKFGEIIPDAPERILRMAEKEQEHRISLESQIVPANNQAGRRGQLLGAFISVLALVLAVAAAYIGAPWQVSVAIVGVPVLSVARSLVTAFRSPPE